MIIMNEELIPYIIVLFCFFLLFGLLYSRYLLTKRNTKTEVEIGNGQTIGTREEQDDSFGSMTTPIGTIAVIADGISGLANGKKASIIATNTFLNEFSQLKTHSNIQSYFSTTAQIANRDIIQNLKGTSGGTTLASVIVDQSGYLHWGAVGDSLITIFRDGDFISVNKKDIYENVLEERYLSGEMTINEVKTNPMRKRLINYLGFTGFKNIEIGNNPIKLNKKDKVLLYSDGVSDSLTEVELENILSKELSPYDAAQEIIEIIEEKQLKNQDNATVVILANGW